jgi:hypothetical protein
VVLHISSGSERNSMSGDAGIPVVASVIIRLADAA